MRMIHRFVVTMIMPKPGNLDCVTCADAEIIYEVINRRLVDTPQLLLYAMQCSSGNTKDPVVLPHLVRLILEYLHLECPPVEDEVRIGRIFVPSDLQKLVLHADLGRKIPPPSLEKTLRLPAPSPKKISQDLPSTSGESRPDLRSGDSLAMIQQLADLNDKVVILTTRVEE